MNLLSKENLSVYDFKFIDIDNNNIELTKFEGKPILLVNTASRCGFTPQYQGLQNLFLNYRKTNLTIIATTSNSFNQEYSSTEEIKNIFLKFNTTRSVAGLYPNMCNLTHALKSMQHCFM